MSTPTDQEFEQACRVVDTSRFLSEAQLLYLLHWALTATPQSQILVHPELGQTAHISRATDPRITSNASGKPYKKHRSAIC